MSKGLKYLSDLILHLLPEALLLLDRLPLQLRDDHLVLSSLGQKLRLQEGGPAQSEGGSAESAGDSAGSEFYEGCSAESGPAQSEGGSAESQGGSAGSEF